MSDAVDELVATIYYPLTTHQLAVYRFILAYINEHTVAPGFHEIAEHFGYKSLATVHEHLQNLERKNWIKRAFNERRAITPLVTLDDEVPAR